MNIRRVSTINIFLVVMLVLSTSFTARVALAWQTIIDPRTKTPTALEWQLDSKGVLTIQKRTKTKAGENCAVPDWGKWNEAQGGVDWYGGTDKRPWSKKYVAIKKLVIKAPITSLGDFSFYYDYDKAFSIMAVQFPSTIKKLGAYCFHACLSLQMMKGTENLEYIGNNAFEATGFVTFAWPKRAMEVADETFKGCNKLKTITGLEHVTKIGQGAFWNCAFESFKWPTAATQIKSNTFTECDKLKRISGLNNVTKIEACAFMGAGIETFDWPNSVKVIEEQTFRGCEHLKKITGIEEVTTIGTEAFSGTAFESFIVPHNVTVIDRGVFSFMLKLKKVVLSSETSLIAQNAFSACENLETITYDGNENEEYGTANFPKTLQFILEDAFSNGEYTESGAPSIQKIVLPSSIKYLGKNAFANCKKLSQIVVNEPLERISFGGVVFAGTNAASKEKGHLVFCGEQENFEKKGWNVKAKDLFGNKTKSNWNEASYQKQ